MYNGFKILGLIPARGGSKGIKDKNIVDLCGKPLIAYTIEAARNSKYIDEVIVSTDSEKISNVARQYGARVPFLRPQNLALDTSRTIDAVIHAIGYMKKEFGETYDVLVLLQPTQPLRSTSDIDGALEIFFDKGQIDLVSVSEVEDNPILVRTLERNGMLHPILDMRSTCRRQDMPVYYKVNGCIYINKVSDIDENTSFNDNKIGYVMSSEHSVDIDELKDLKITECYLTGGFR
jgi:CMP-N-acetylneuraminic acid synthetase